jgi:serine/threonine-protein kinase
VYAARRTGTSGADYALKLARSDSPSLSAQSGAMLRREALIGSQISHANLVAVLDYQVRDKPLLVLPRIEGVSLRGLLELRRREYGCLIGAAKCLPQSVWIIRQVAEALAALHAAGWIHGDVEPENMLVAPHGHATLIDLGLARRIGSRECLGGEVLSATPAYVSPESLLPGKQLVGESDVYSLGVVLFELLTGEPLIRESDPAALALAHLRQAAPDVRQAALDVPPQLARLVERMLAKEPLRRPTAEEIVRQLTRLEIELLA